MDYPARFEWQTRCEFNAFCKRTLRNELIDVCRERKSRKLHEVSFADLTPQEEKQLYYPLTDILSTRTKKPFARVA